MNKHDFIESTAAGLRKMDVPPDFLLVIVDRFDDCMFDDLSICGIPVIKSYISVNEGYSGFDYPIIPCFKTLDATEIYSQVIHFQRGFSDKCGIF